MGAPPIVTAYLELAMRTGLPLRDHDFAGRSVIPD
jgi:hypothetical protein